MDYKIKSELKDYISEILWREKIEGIFEDFTIEQKEGGYILSIDAPKEYVLTVFEEAEGMKDMLENNRKTPKYGWRILSDPDYFKRCLLFYDTPCFRTDPEEVAVIRDKIGCCCFS